MQEAVRLHDGVLRAVIAAQDGVVFKTVGDAFYAAFVDARDAVLAAVMAQRAFQSGEFSAPDLRVRIALHTGKADERDGDYFGPVVNRVARLVAVAHGGQILLSSATAELIGSHRENGLALRDLGKHRLKDIPELLDVRQLLAEGIPSDFPPLRSQNTHAGNLPYGTTSFVGRGTETADVLELVRAHRLVTLLGPGGIGKTRLSLHVAGSLAAKFDDGAWFVDLAPIADGTLVAGRIAEAVGVKLPPGEATVDALVSQIADKNALLVLDNCEHLVDAAAVAAEALLSHCGKVKILATSREPLTISGEQRYRTPTLETPEAVALFAERARAADQRFALDDANRGVIEEICCRLDGIALAIELAAARLNVLSATVLAEKLNERFTVLAGGSRTAQPRQRTLRALIDWSYDLLDEKERAVFRKLAVFAGGFSFELAGAVAGAGDDVFDIVESLIDKSLVQVEEVDGEKRARLLESIRKYARDRLRERGEETETRRRHALAYLELAQDLAGRFESTPDALWTARARLDLDNWRAALQWSLDEGFDVDLGRQLAIALRARLVAARAFRWPARGRRGTRDGRLLYTARYCRGALSRAGASRAAVDGISRRRKKRAAGTAALRRNR